MPVKPLSTDLFAGQSMPLQIEYRKRRNARRYILRPNARGDGGCVTIPRGGGWAEARAFARRNLFWLEERLKKWRERARVTEDQNTILFRGELARIEEMSNGGVMLGGEWVAVPASEARLPERLKQAFWKLAQAELPGRVGELAAEHGLIVKRVAVRNQRSRWGSCSQKKVISLNWRLIQAPPFVRDYIIIHELMHLREMNHSGRYWKLVYEAFPRTDEAEKWLRVNGSLLRA